MVCRALGRIESAIIVIGIGIEARLANVLPCMVKFDVRSERGLDKQFSDLVALSEFLKSSTDMGTSQSVPVLHEGSFQRDHEPVGLSTEWQTDCLSKDSKID